MKDLRVRELLVCLYVCMCMHVCVYACMRVCMYACMYVCMHGWVDGWMDVCMYVCVVWRRTKHASRHDNRRAARDKEISATTQHARKFLAKCDSLTHDGDRRNFCKSLQSVTFWILQTRTWQAKRVLTSKSIRH